MNWRSASIRCSFAFVVAASLVFCSQAWAQAYVWINPDGGNWNDPVNWSPSSVPPAGATAILGGNTAYTVTMDYSPSTTLVLENPLAELRMLGSNPFDGIKGPGTITVNSEGNTVPVTLHMPFYKSEIDARVRLNSAAIPRNWATVRCNLPITIGPNGWIEGRGTISGSFTNLGVIAASGPESDIEITGDGTIWQGFSGQILAENEGNIDAYFIDGGTIEARSGGSLRILGVSNAAIAVHQNGLLDLRNSTVDACTLKLDDGGTALYNNCTFSNMSLPDGFGIPSGQLVRFGPGLKSDASLIVNIDQGPDEAVLLPKSASSIVNLSVRLNAGSSQSIGAAIIKGSPAFGEEAVITGRGTITSKGLNPGTLSPGVDSAGLEIGEIALGNSHALAANARVLIDIAGSDSASHDRLTGGTLSMGGLLAISYLGDYLPLGHERIRIISGYAVKSRFDAVAFTERRSPTGPERVVYTDDSVMVVMCFADADGNGYLNIDDFVAFQTSFIQDDAGADCDLSGDLTINDFVCFQAKFAVGC